MQIQKIGTTQVVRQSPQITFGSSESMIAKFIEQSKTEYLKIGISNSLLKNGHMNEYIGEPIDLQKAGKIVSSLSNQIIQDLEPKGNNLKKKDLINWCLEFSENFHKSDISRDFSLSEKTRDAIVVDFLNFTCLNQWIDLGLYTKDLQKLAK